MSLNDFYSFNYIILHLYFLFLLRVYQLQINLKWVFFFLLQCLSRWIHMDNQLNSSFRERRQKRKISWSHLDIRHNVSRFDNSLEWHDFECTGDEISKHALNQLKKLDFMKFLPLPIEPHDLYVF